jgi:hypothetical protein
MQLVIMFLSGVGAGLGLGALLWLKRRGHDICTGCGHHESRHGAFTRSCGTMWCSCQRYTDPIRGRAELGF